MIMNPEIKKWR